MNMNTENILKDILARIAQIDYVKPGDIPDIDLYMDQVTTFMDGQLASSKRHEEDKILTKTMIAPLTEKYFDNGKDFNITSIYEEVCALGLSHVGALQEDVTKIYMQAMESFDTAEGEEQDYLQFFSFICSLSFDVYVKKLLIEQLIDKLPEPEHGKKKKEK